MQNFGRGLEPPKSYIDAITSSFRHPKSSHNSIIASHPFNFGIQIFVPQSNDTITTQQILTKLNFLNDDALFYHVCEISALKMIELCQSTLETGEKQIYVHNVCSNCQTSNVFAIYPADNGHDLVLRLDKDTYERMGLQGSLDTMDNKYVVKRKLPMKKGEYDRIKWAFERIQTPLRLLIAVYDVTGKAISMDTWLTVSNDPIQTRVLSDIKVPLLKHEDSDLWEVQEKFIQWLGIASCEDTSHLLMSEENTSLLGDTVISELTEDISIASDRLHVLSTQGFIPPHKVADLLQRLQGLMKEIVMPWSVITVTGFEDAPVSFKGLGHGYNMSGDNDYTIVLLPDEAYWLLRCMGSQEQRM